MITYLKWLNNPKKVMLEPLQKYFRNNDVTKTSGWANVRLARIDPRLEDRWFFCQRRG